MNSSRDPPTASYGPCERTETEPRIPQPDSERKRQMASREPREL
jgi:hypothetical protein